MYSLVYLKNEFVPHESIYGIKKVGCGLFVCCLYHTYIASYLHHPVIQSTVIQSIEAFWRAFV